MITGRNEAKTMIRHTSRNSNLKWNHDKCQQMIIGIKANVFVKMESI